MASAATNNSSTSSSSMSPRHVSEPPRHVSENRGSPTAQSRRPSRQPWTQIVRGESEPTIAAAVVAAPSKASIDPIASASVAPPSPLSTAAAGEDRSEESGDQGNAGKKPAWNRPSNGASEIGPVMGASSWPALSETTKAPSNKSSSDSSIGDVPSSVSQGAASASVPSPKQLGRANNPNPTPNHSRQRSFKRSGASGHAANGTTPQPSAQGSLVEGTSHNPSPRGQSQKNGFASQTHGGGTDNQRDSHRNQNGNHHHQNHGGRRSNQEHGNQNWNFHRSFNGRDGNAQSQRGTPAFVRYAPPPPPPVQAISPQFMAAQPIQSFGSPVPFPPELAPPFYPGMPFVAPLSPGPVFYHVQDPPLNIKLQNQIHYYFSEENLIKDTYLREQMDDQGFAPLHVIAGFRKVAELTDSIQQIVEALQGSPFVEVQGDRIRKRHNWQHWLIPSPQSVDAVASRVGNLSIGQNSAEPIGGSGSQPQPGEAENKAVSDGQPESSGVDPVSNSNVSGGANR
ncbi:hypothetical protein Bca4012_054515 [Brassica carinata]|uniref:HTH La-type RNA-binding domain-containing protein n=1 Tax=Brassica carinata TaxID=52824 RepID=A0A8X7VXM0_BRACI|nr:hypothetical protein Bca52824_012430 [Brassica carinata]